MAVNRVLLIGNSESISYVFKGFKKQGLEVLEAKTFTDILKIFKTEIELGLIIIDFELEDLEGVELVEQIRHGTFESYSKTPIVVFAGEDQKPLQQKVKNLNIHGWIHPPIDDKILNIIYQKFFIDVDADSNSNMFFEFKKELSSLIKDSDGQLFKSFSTQISSSEVDIVSFKNLEVNSILTLDLSENITLEVKWTKNIKPKVYYSGLHPVDKNIDLLKEVKKAGLIDELKPIKKGFDINDLVKKYDIKIDAIREILRRLHSRDNSLLSKLKLDKSKKSFDSYPIRYEEKPIIIVIDASSSPGELSKLENNELEEKMKIFGEYSQGKQKKWALIWPVNKNS